MIRKPSRLVRVTADSARSAKALRVGIESLEGRTLLSSVVVNSISDTDAAGTVTLRDAISIANSSTSPTTITFDPTVFATVQTITLSGTQLEFNNTTQSTSITGPAAGVSISGNQQSRVFMISQDVTASVSGVTIIDGSTSGGGGGVENFGSLTMNGSTVTGNTSALAGGAIENFGSMTLENDSLTDNTGLSGGGIQNCDTLSMTDVTISNNTTSGHGGGFENFGENLGDVLGGEYLGKAVATLDDVTLSNNASDRDGGGGIASDVNGGSGITTLVLNNVTVADNTSTTNGGGILLDSSNSGTILAGVTIVGNSTADFGGGLVDGAGTSASLANTIIAGNSASSGGPDVYGGAGSLGHNLIGETDGSSGWISSDFTGIASAPLNADLGSLANNGGPTETLLPASNSPAISHGSVALISSGITTDQRGDARTVNGAVDIGAVEVGGPAVSTVASVTTIAASAHTQVVGQADTFTVSVASASGTGAVPTGTVTISEDGSTLGTYALTNGQVSETYTVPAQSAGTVFTAVYSGDSNYSASTSSGATEVYLPTSVASAKITKPSVPSPTIAGQKYIAKIPVVLTNSGSPMNGTFSAVLYADVAGTGLDSTPVQIGSLSKRTTVKTGRTLTLSLAIKTLPASLPAGTYHLVVELANPDGGYDLVTTAQTVTVESPFVALTATASAVKPATLAVNKSGTVTITVTNTGNVNASGAFSAVLSPSVDGVTLYPGVSFTLSKPTVTLKPNKPTKYVLHLKVTAALPAGLYFTDTLITLDGVTTTAVGSQFTIG